jgi:hypothetical protein
VHVLNAEIRDVFDSKEHATNVRIEFQPHPKSVLVIFPGPCRKATIYCSDRPRFTKQHGLLIGEALHNFRGSLDHLAWISSNEWERGDSPDKKSAPSPSL